MKNNYKILINFVCLAFATQVRLDAQQQTYTFTNAGASGRYGPTQAQVNTAYTGSNLQGSVTVVGNGIQRFPVNPGIYRITAAGAQGGSGASYSGGLGASMRGDFTLTTASTLNIIVGQQGEYNSNGYNTGGGGGSFVWITGSSQPLIAAGGGGGAGNASNGIGAVTTATGTAGSGSNSAGANGAGANPGGGGWLSAGIGFQASYTSCTVKCSGNVAGWVEGGASPTTAIVFHGCSGTSLTGDGGFGGGQGASGECGTNNGAGGGGGYSGGTGQSGNQTGGGGGGSYNGGTNQTNTASINSGNGKVIIQELCSVSIMSSFSGTTNPVVMCAGTTVTLTTDAVSNYSWSTGATTSSIVVSPSTNTVYSVYATSSLACNATGVITFSVASSAPVLSISNPSSNICLGRTVTLTASGAVTYTWANPGVVNGQAFTPTATTVYTVTGQNGCGTSQGTTTITVSPLVVTASAAQPTICSGYGTQLTASSSVSGYTWQPVSQTGSVAYIAPYSTTLYTVTASDGTCSGTQTVLVTTKTTPTITTAEAVSNICPGESVTLTAFGAGANGTYSWNPAGSGPSIVLTPSISIPVSVVGTNSLGCSSTTNQVILVGTPPALTITASKTLVCTGGSVVLTGSGANSYQWTNGPGTPGYTINPTAPSNVYTVTASQTSNTCITTGTIEIATIIPNVSLLTATTICKGAVATLTASGATTYSWNGVTSPSGSNQVSPTTTTIYTLTANTSSGTSSNSVSCKTTDFATVTVNPLPSLTVTPLKDIICKGETHKLTATGATTYTWSNVTPSATDIVVVSPTATTVYVVTGTDANGCVNTTSYTAKVKLCNGVAEAGALKSISVYPNPNTGEFVVSTDADMTLTIVNAAGEVVRSLKLDRNNEHKVMVKDLSSGVYFIVGENSEGKVNQKIIVTK